MPSYSYRIVNVFADPASTSPLTGNPLCVFEDARGLDTAAMQALALQFNLSETVFVLPSDKATARIRIFTTAFEMPFAGHPTLGSAQVVRALKTAGNQITLETGAGVIPVTARGDAWTLKANAPKTRAFGQSNAWLAQTLGINATDISHTPLWVNTGNEQIVVPLAGADAVRRCKPDAQRMAGEQSADGNSKIYVWADADNHAGGGHLFVRFFLLKHGALSEDHGTGSAAANLGGWYVAQKTPLPLKRVIHQGEVISRPAQLLLEVDAGGGIYVSGHVVELGAGVVNL
jgi:trans-2,3-dihydro-3-hydroxyanthranilate isomerase